MTSTIIVSSGVTSDTTVSAGVLMDVFDSGSTVSVTVASGGAQSVYAGGVANRTAVDFGGIQSVSAGGIASVSDLYGGTQFVDGGGIASQTTLTDGAKQYLAAGATAVDTVILNGGDEYVASGATASDTLVKVGNIRVGAGGTTIGAELAPSGNELVAVGGFASGTIISGGALRLGGGNGSGTLIRGYLYKYGREYVSNSGSEVGAVVSLRGQLIVTDGGTTTGTILSAGPHVGFIPNSLEVVSSGGVAYGTKVYANGNLIVQSGGQSYQTIVESGGSYDTGDVEQPGGTVGLLVSSGGTEIVIDFNAETTPTSTTILAGGNEIIDIGYAYDTQLFGSSTVFSGGVTFNPIIMSGGYEDVKSSGTAPGAMIMPGGVESVEPDGLVASTTIAGGTLETDTYNFSGGVSFTGSGGVLDIGSTQIPQNLFISGFVAGDTIVLPGQIFYSAGAYAVVNTPGVVTISGVAPSFYPYNLNIAGAYVGESDFVVSDAYYGRTTLTKSSTPQMQFLRPHVAPTDAGLNLTPSLDMLTNPSTTTRPAAAPSMAASTSATIAPVPHLVTSAPHPLVIPPHGV